MLTKEQIELVKTTVPVLREHGVALISHFYKRMLSHNPELMQVFNMGHQRAGFQQQALAGSVLAYAENIENLKPLFPFSTPEQQDGGIEPPPVLSSRFFRFLNLP